MGALTVTIDKFSNLGNQRANQCTITFSASYATGGDTYTNRQFGLEEINSVQIVEPGGVVVSWDGDAKTFLAFQSAGAAAPTFTGTPLAAHTHDILVIGGQAAAGTDTVQAAAGDTILGKEEAGNVTIDGASSATEGGVVAITGGTPAGTISAIGAGNLSEVAAATDLSAISFKATVFGF